jgi:hypothetical protein
MEVYQSNKEGLGAMHLDSMGILWVEEEKRNESYDILCFAPPYAKGPVRRISLGDGTCLSPGILDFAEDSPGGIWISTNRGLWHLPSPVE